MKNFEFFKIVAKTKENVKVFNPYTECVVEMDWSNFNRQFKVDGIKAYPKNAYKKSLDNAHHLIVEIANEIGGQPNDELVNKVNSFMSTMGINMLQMKDLLDKEIKFQRQVAKLAERKKFKDQKKKKQSSIEGCKGFDDLKKLFN